MQVTECVPRANSRYALPSDFAVPKALPIKQPTKEKTKTMVRTQFVQLFHCVIKHTRCVILTRRLRVCVCTQEEKNKNGTGDKKKDGWAAGTGYGHGMRQGGLVCCYGEQLDLRVAIETR